MKNILLKFVFTCLILSPHLIQAQQIGLKVGYNLFQLRGGGVIDKWILGQDDYADEGTSIGLFFRKNHKNLFFQTELQFTNNWDDKYMINTSPQEYPFYVNGETNGTLPEPSLFGGQEKFRRIDFPLVCGVRLIKFNKWISLNGHIGLLPAMVFHKDAYRANQAPNTNDPNYPLQRGYAVIGSSDNSYHPFTLEYILGLGLDIWNFTLDTRYVNSITNISSKALFEDREYPLARKSSQLMFSFGYKINLK
jgi:hypothetical protein